MKVLFLSLSQTAGLVFLFSNLKGQPIHIADAYETCPASLGGGICPTNNTCCLRSDGYSGCIPSDLGALNATCCSDGLTGCAVGYQCGSDNTTCIAGHSVTDPLVQILPRYPLCHTRRLRHVHGFPLQGDAKLAYYSSHGDLTAIRNNDEIQMVVMVIHGAVRNADDYFCAIVASSELQSTFTSDQVLVLAPYFPITTDPALDLEEGGDMARWEDDGDGGPWRSGADAVSPREAETISSYEALDKMVAWIMDQDRFTATSQISVIGHSAGGQFVQRWSLLTSYWDDRFRGVVANPSSYAYLTPLRFYNHQWQLPPKDECPEYNHWKWGLDLSASNATVSKYVQKAIKSLGKDSLIERFATRDMIYLAGSQDICSVPGDTTGWCSSHGLETTCGDEMEGWNRWERHGYYLISLEKVGVPYRRKVVTGVGHDHSLMFNSKNGLDSIFGPLRHVTADEQ